MLQDVVNQIVDFVFIKFGNMLMTVLEKIFSSIIDFSYAIALLGAGLAILFGLIGFNKYYRVAGGFFLAYVLINYLMG